MNKEDLKNYKEKLSQLSDMEKRLRVLEQRKYASGELQGPPTGYASIDKLWLGNYPEFLFHLPHPHKRIIDSINDVWKDNENIIEYNGTNITKKELMDKAQLIAKSLDSYGIKKGDSILTSLESVPEVVELILASEILGCSVKNYMGDNKDIINLINLDKTIKLYVCPDYTNKQDIQDIKDQTHVENVVSVSPLESTKKEVVREKILEEIENRYTENSVKDEECITWDDFLENGRNNTNEIVENQDNNIKLFSAFTSGTTGVPKEVIHSSNTMLGIINQMALFPNREEHKEKWLLTILPPTLVATVVAMIFQPMISGKKVILDPYCKIEDLDLEMMHYEPNNWPLIPIFFNSLVNSKRIPEDYDMSYFEMIGFGAEPVTAKFINETHTFLEKHNCKAHISSGYGQSEGGSDFTIAMGSELLSQGCSGLPLIDTTIAIFEPKTSNELEYNQIGEVCKSGPGLMLGYSDEKLTQEVIKTHEDGTVWLHTGDYGYINNYGLLYVLGRDAIKIYPDKEVFGLQIENKVCKMEGIKDAVVVIGTDQEHEGYNEIHLFVIPENKENEEEFIEMVEQYIEENLKEEERPKEIHVISKKPISKFKTDRKVLKKNYHIQ